MSKTVISTQEGTRLGEADQILVDTKTMMLEALQLAKAAPGLGGPWVPLIKVAQIGDVVLVDTRDAACEAPRIASFAPFLKLPVRDRSGARRVFACRAVAPCAYWPVRVQRFLHDIEPHSSLVRGVSCLRAISTHWDPFRTCALGIVAGNRSPQAHKPASVQATPSARCKTSSSSPTAA